MSVTPQPQEGSLNFCAYLENASTCCNHARLAVEQGRYRAAHGLFQTAITFYDSAQELARTPDSNSPESFLAWHQRLQAVLQEIELCANDIYQDPASSTHQEASSLSGEKERNIRGDQVREAEPTKRLFAFSPMLELKGAEWTEANRNELRDFIDRVANTTLKIKILQLFLNDPGLCLSSYYLADKLGVSMESVSLAAQQLCKAGSFNYCPRFAFTDLCNLSLAHVSRDTRQKLEFLRFALGYEPEWVWKQVKEREEEQRTSILCN